MLRTPSFDFEAQFRHAQEGYSDSKLHIDLNSPMDRRLQRKIVVCQKRFHRYRSRTPPTQARQASHPSLSQAHTARKPLIKNIPRAFKTFISRSPTSQSQNVPLRLNRLHGADHSRMSILSPALRKEFRKISYQNPQSSRVVVNLDSSSSPQSQKSDSRRQPVPHQHQHQQPQPQPQPQSQLQPQPQPQPQPQLKPQAKPLRLAAGNHNDTVPTQILPSRQTPPSRLDQSNECVAVEPQSSISDPSRRQLELNHAIHVPEQRPILEPHSDSPSKPTELPLNISTLINKYDKDDPTADKSNNKKERSSLIPETQHKFATMRALFEDGPTEQMRPSSLRSPPRSNTTPVSKCKPYNASSEPGVERTSISPLSRTSPSIGTSRHNSDQVLKRHGTRFVKSVGSPNSPADHASVADEGSLISSVTKSPDDDTGLGNSEEEHVDLNSRSLEGGTGNRDIPERMNLRDLFDSLELSPDEKENAAVKTRKANKAREPSSSVAKLIARYGGTNQATEKANNQRLETGRSTPRKEMRKVEHNLNRSLVMDEEDEIQKVYKTETKQTKKVGRSVDQIPERKGGVEAIPWEARIKSFDVEIEEAASMAYIRKVMSHDGENDRFKSFSVYSGADQDSKARARSETSGRRWRRRSARAQNKSWLSRKAHEQVHKVKKHVGNVRNIISADDY
ncbi:E1A-binding protein p400 [Gracilaria domingensis]|nr:E1A-binding protein p400 [Gracilaria domingensis]